MFLLFRCFFYLYVWYSDPHCIFDEVAYISLIKEHKISKTINNQIILVSSKDILNIEIKTKQSMITIATICKCYV